MMIFKRMIMFFCIVMLSGVVRANEPIPWQVTFQSAVTDLMVDVVAFNNFLLVIMLAIVLFVLFLLLYVSVRFNAKTNPIPSKTTHNIPLEIVWTIIPVIILIVIAVPSLRLLYKQSAIPKAEMTLKVTGNQWYWGYEYPDYDSLSFDAVMLEDDELKEGDLRLLATDNRVVIPVDTVVRVVVTASDVLHSWAMPSFGIKLDAVPGRLNETWFKVNKTGIYYGQCSELCGVRHGFMPIMIQVVEKDVFAKWIKKAQQQFASYPDNLLQMVDVSHEIK